jgi:xanthine dehydrogenase small subunit
VSDRVQFQCNGASVDVEVAPGESLLSVLREQLGLVSVKDGCAPQGQCGCCTVLVDGDARVACVTPATRVAGRSVTTVEGLDPAIGAALADGLCATGGSQCGFCTPGIVVRAAALLGRGRAARRDLDRALAAHLCRCTGWRTIYEAVEEAVRRTTSSPRDLEAASRRAMLEGGVSQRVGPDVPLGGGGFADDDAPRDALVAVPVPLGADGAGAFEAAGLRWVVADTVVEARGRAGKVQGRRSTLDSGPPLALPPRPRGGVRLATGWVEPAYLELDASWCEPGGCPATPLANGGAFGGKQSTVVTRAARELADRLGRPVRVLLSREDTVRLGPKRPPMAGAAVVRDSTVTIKGTVSAGGWPAFASPVERWPYRVAVDADWGRADVSGPPVSGDLRAAGLAEHALLLEGALTEAGADRASLVRDDRAGSALLDTCAPGPRGSGALAGARVRLDQATGAVSGVEVRVVAGDPLDEVVLRSYAIGAAHMALGWVLTEGLTVDPATGEVHDLTIRSFGIIRAKDTPPIDVTIVDDPGPPHARTSDAVFAAVASATWNAVAQAERVRPETFPARGTRAARLLRR